MFLIPDCNKICPKNIQPVCGSDGNTYDNECVMGVAACENNIEISKVSDGEWQSRYVL